MPKDAAPIQPSWDDLAKARYVSLTTFRKSGEAVATAIWIAADGEALVVSTHSDSGKVKRLRNNSRVELAPSSAGGAVKAGVAPVAGTAELIFDPDKREPFERELRQKYGWQDRILTWFEKRRGGRATDRVILRITPA